MSLILNKSLKELYLDRNINNDTLFNNFKYNTMQINKSNNLNKNRNIVSSIVTRNLLKNYSAFDLSSKENNNNEIYKFEKEIVSENKNCYKNRATPHKEPEEMFNLLHENQKKFSLNQIINKTFSEFKNSINNYNPKNEHEIINEYQLKNFYFNYVRKGFFGRKNKDNLPLNFPLVSTSLNIYSSKSEKERYEKLLNEFGKLDYYLKIYPNNKLQIIKDFLIKYHITDLNQYSKEQILNIENYVKQFSFFLEPNKDIKSILKDILDGKIKINKFNKKKTYISPYYVNWKKKLDENKANKIDYYKNLDLIKQNKLYVEEKNYSKNYQNILNDLQLDINQYNEKNLNDIKKDNHFHNFNFVTSLKKPHPIESLKIVLTSKKKKIQKIMLQKSKSQGKYSISKITNRLYYNRIRKPLDMTQIQKNKKITEFAAYNIAKNNIFMNNINK